MTTEALTRKLGSEKPIMDRLDAIAARIRNRTFGGAVRDYVRKDVHGYTRVVIEQVGQKEVKESK